ncbi:uncharacterized protein LOC131891263 [Tigriopus californicus]|uniref:uncharacterized protein LOC131891263 n=1 Tax=Tigriopus californicus TaxID=6832 RepID=UPI0027D9EE87|nr:uncharacterized protein LOC131891263 [Tigriopus californicus]
MGEQLHKKQRVSDLLNEDVAIQDIIKIVKVSQTMVYNIKHSKAMGEGVQQRPGLGGHNSKPKPEFLESLDKKIREDPMVSMCHLATSFEVNEGTIRRAVHDNLGTASNARTPRHLLTKKLKQKRLLKCQKLLNWIKSKPSTVKNFSEKKIVAVDHVVNHRNNCWLAESIEDVQRVYRTKHPAEVMVLGVGSYDGKKMHPYFFDPGAKVGTDAYYKVLRYHMLPWIKSNYPEGDYVWQQDSAPSHNSTWCQMFFQEHMAKFWSKDFWPPSSPDLNPLDFFVWRVMEKEINIFPARRQPCSALKPALL